YPLRVLLLLLAKEIEGVLDVVVAGEGQIAVKFLEAVAVRETAYLLQYLGRPAGAREVEHTQVLLGARWGVDPGDITLIALGRLADTEPPIVPLLLKASAMPDELEVIREVQRVEVLVRRRKRRH